MMNGYRCGLCGLRNGYKAKCATGRCHAHGEKNKPHHFHATCARQAGFEVAHYNEDDFVGKFINKLFESLDVLKCFFFLSRKAYE